MKQTHPPPTHALTTSGEEINSYHSFAQSAGAVEYTDCFSAEG